MHGRGRVVDLSESAMHDTGGSSMSDHYPWDNNDRAAFLADVAALLVAAPPAYPPQKFVKRGYYMCCATCGMAIAYCPGHPPPDAPESAGVKKDLAQRRDGRA